MQIVVGGALVLLLLVAAGSLVVAAGVRGLVTVALGIYVAASSLLVAVVEGLSLAGKLDRSAMLAAEAVLASAGVALLVRFRPVRPALRLPRGPVDATLILLGAGVGVSTLYHAVLVATLPPSNNDAMVYHLARAAYWYQHHGIAYIPHPPNAILNAYPVNGEIGILFSFLVSGSDRLVAAPQLIAGLALLASVYGIARRLGFGRCPSVFAALVTGTLPQVVLQSTTPQNDLTAAGFIAAAVYFLLGETSMELGLAAAAAALAVGTKDVALLALPFLALLAAWRQRSWRVVPWGAAAFVLLGSYSYLQNWIEVGDPLGHPGERTSLRAEAFPRPLIDAAHLVYRFFEVPGLAPSVAFGAGTLFVAGAAVALALTSSRRPALPAAGLLGVLAPIWLIFPAGLLGGGLFPADWPNLEPSRVFFNLRANEDLAYFGPLGVVLLLLIGCELVFAARNRSITVRTLLAAALPLFLLTYVLTLRYQLFAGRFFLLPVAAGAPLFALVYRHRAARITVTALALATLVLVDATNEAKPLRSHSQWIWQRDRVEAETQMQPAMRTPLRRLSREVPARADVAVSVGTDDWTYYAFGGRLTRRVTFVPASTALASARRAGATWLISSRPLAAKPGWHVIQLTSGLTLLHDAGRDRGAARSGGA